MKFLKNLAKMAMVALAAIAIGACDEGDNGGGNEVNYPDLKLKIEVEDIDYTTVKLKVSHDLENELGWYGFLSKDITTSAQSLIQEELAKGDYAQKIHHSKQYVTVLEGLEPNTDYRYIAFGLTDQGVVYGHIADVDFKTLGSDIPDDMNGMYENSAWQVMYIGQDEVDGVSFEHVIKVLSTDNNPYAITIVYDEYYDPTQLREMGELMYDDMLNYLHDYNLANGTSYGFIDMLYIGSASCPFDMMPGRYRAVAMGYTHEGEVSGLYAVSDPFEVKEAAATPNYSAWLGEWLIDGQNKATEVVTVTKAIANKSFYMSGWEGFDDLQIEVEYNAELDAMFFYSQLVAKDYDLGENGIVDIYLFAGNDEGYYDNTDGDYYIAIGGILDDGVRAWVRYGVNVPGYPKFTQMFFMALRDGKFYSLTPEEEIPSFIAGMYPTEQNRTLTRKPTQHFGYKKF